LNALTPSPCEARAFFIDKAIALKRENKPIRQQGQVYNVAVPLSLSSTWNSAPIREVHAKMLSHGTLRIHVSLHCPGRRP
jgi:hypothetical protein